MSREHVLKVENVTMQFGGVIAVDNMNLEVNQGEIVSLIRQDDGIQCHHGCLCTYQRSRIL